MKLSLFRQPSLTSMITIGITVCAVLIFAVFMAIQYYDFKNGVRDEFKNHLTSITTISALNQNGDELSKVSASNDDLYRKIHEHNIKILLSDPEILNVYAMRKNEQGILLIVHASRTGDYDITEFGQPNEQPSQILEENFDSLDRTIVEPDFLTGVSGLYISAYAPIYDSSGVRAGVLGVDIDANKIIADERGFIYRGLVIFLLLLPIIALAGYLIGRQLSQPFTDLAANVQRKSEGKPDAGKQRSFGLKEAVTLEAGLNGIVHNIETQVSNLEGQIAEKNKNLEKRSWQVQAISSIARTITSLQDTSSLSEMTTMISNLLGFYHVGIFLLDEKGENVQLIAANGDEGKIMLESQYRQELDRKSNVGSVVSQGEFRIVRDFGTDVAVRNPYLPDTRSEFIAPLRVGERILGILDIHSMDPDAFSEEKITILNTAANQIAVVIESARLSKETSEAIRESKEAVARYIEREWGGYSYNLRNKGYFFDGKRVIPLGEKVNLGENRHLPQTGRLTLEKETSELLVPIRLRGQIIGFINAKTKGEKRHLTKDDIDLLEAAAERTALTLENARLIEIAQRRANRERTIGEISAKLGAVSDIDSVMQAAVEELGRRISGTAEVVFELEDEY